MLYCSIELTYAVVDIRESLSVLMISYIILMYFVFGRQIAVQKALSKSFSALAKQFPL